MRKREEEEEEEEEERGETRERDGLSSNGGEPGLTRSISGSILSYHYYYLYHGVYNDAIQLRSI